MSKVLIQRSEICHVQRLQGLPLSSLLRFTHNSMDTEKTYTKKPQHSNTMLFRHAYPPLPGAADWALLEWHLERIRDERTGRHRYRLPLRYGRPRERDQPGDQSSPVRAKPVSVARLLEHHERERAFRAHQGDDTLPRGRWGRRRERSRSPAPTSSYVAQPSPCSS